MAQEASHRVVETSAQGLIKLHQDVAGLHSCLGMRINQSISKLMKAISRTYFLVNLHQEPRLLASYLREAVPSS